MRGCARTVLIGMIVGLSGFSTMAAPPPELSLDQPEAVAPRLDDACLHDVQFVGQRLGWAVGDHGAVWHTADGGATWTLLPSPVDCPLRSVCFLTDRVGWVVGGGTVPFTRVPYGVVLFTQDGGATWEQLAREALPPLTAVRFFGLEEGIAVGESSTEHPTGVFTTADGGKTWQAVPGPGSAGWRTAAFVTPEVGVVAGLRGKVALVGGGRLIAPRVGDLGIRGLRDVWLAQDGAGWLAGDGGLVLKTANGGVSWEAPSRPLPLDLADVMDFRAIDVRGEKAWFAGSPGSIVWHTPDGGRSWQKQPTGHPAPIESLAFVSDTEGWAVGALGTILHTTDAGRTWQVGRGGGRRVAILGMHARPTAISFPLLAQQSAELGYRSLMLLPARRDIGPDGHEALDADLRLHEAVISAGGSAGEFGWRLPVGIPGIEHQADKLIADWNRRTEGKLSQVLLGDLVCQLRTWRPSLVVLNEPSSDDATTKLLNEAMLQAVRFAADPTRFSVQQRLAELGPWQVQRVYLRLPPGSTGDAHVEPFAVLPRAGGTVQSVAALAAGKLHGSREQSAVREAYRLIFDASRPNDGSSLPPVNRAFFVGIPLAPGSEARRPIAAIDETNQGIAERLAGRQRNFQAYAEKFLDDPRLSTQLVAQLRETTAGMSDAQGALQLAALVEEYRKRSQWDLVEATSLELVDRYPEEPAAVAAMRWLLQLWTGAEPAWQRMRETQAARQTVETNVAAIQERLLKAAEQSRPDSPLDLFSGLDLGPDPVSLASKPVDLKFAATPDWRRGRVRRWHEQALHMASTIRTKAPRLYLEPEVQFPLAALLRQRGAHRAADGFYRRYDQGGANDLWKQTAATELWMLQPFDVAPKRILTCRTAAARPVLDGILSDACWQDADEMPLLARADEPPPGSDYAFALLARDAEYLYFAASIPRSPEVPDDRPELAGRTHDADLTRHDRVGLYLDVDRDYVTHYALEIDQRGWTRDTCWEDGSWNPNWFVAADADDRYWRIECAIPLSELVPHSPGRGATWAVGIVRTIPGVGLESWTHPAASRPRLEAFGLVRFD